MKQEFRNRAAALIIHNDAILLVRHKKQGKEAYYLLPGGGVKTNETVEEALKRELLEETGLCVKAIRPVFITESISTDKKRKIRQFVYICEWSGAIKPSTDKRVEKALFVPIKEFIKMTFYPNIKRTIIDCQKTLFPTTPIKISVPWEE